MSRVLMISGANRGIGLAIARAARARGWQLSLGLRPASAPPAGAGLDDALVEAYEARSPKSGQRWLSATLERFGRLDALVNNAGVFRPLEVLAPDDADEAALDEMLEVNCRAPWRLSRLALPALVRSGGRIVNIVSTSGKWVSQGDEAGYCISKFAAMGASEALRAAARSQGVGVTAVCPGWVNTRMSARVDAPGKVEPEEVAGVVMHLLELPARVDVPEVIVNDSVAS